MSSFLSRVMIAGLAASTLTAAQPALAQASAGPQHVMLQQAGGYRIKVGELRVTALTDGSVPQDLHTLLQNTSVQEIDRLLTRNFQANPVEASINAFLIEAPGRLILIDVGSGELFGPGNGGRLLQSLQAMDVRPEQITDILITHIHPDHSGGLVKGGRRAFENAIVHVSQKDVDFFFDASSQSRTGYDKSFFDTARMTMAPYIDAGKVKTFASDGEILPGVAAKLHPGHTPGSAFFTLTSAGEHIVFVGDLIHSEAVQFPKPRITITYDQDATLAADVRQRAFATFAANGDLIAAPHLPFPGLGHVRAEGGQSFSWVAVTYANRKGQ